MNGFVTPEVDLRVRIKRLPQPGEFDEYDLHLFREGEVFDVTAQLGMLLIVGGFAEVAAAFPRSEAADTGYGPPRSKKRRD
jgi:hypothetical protein